MKFQSRLRSAAVMQVTRNLVNDYFNLIPQAASLLRDLPKVAPLFTANFITSVTSLYTLTGLFCALVSF